MRRLTALFCALGAVALAAAALQPSAARGALNSVAGLFEAGDYDAARQTLRQGGEGARPGEETLWRARLATRPDEALELLHTGLEDRALPSEVRLRLALEIADIEYGRGGYAELLRALEPFLGDASAQLPGEAHLKAGLALRALGRAQQAREMLASVRPADPAFVLARISLGDIGLEQGDGALARRYYESAADADPLAARRSAAGRWRALRLAGEEGDAARLLERLQRDDPGALALLTIQRWRSDENEELQARLADQPADTVATRPEAPEGRYALQLGAFSDRGLALDFHRRYLSQLPDLRIDEVRDERGQYLYKIRTGAYVNPALARTAASDLADKLGIDVMVADLAPGARGGN